MQSRNGDVELSVTLSTKGLKSDIQKIKNTIQDEVKNSDVTVEPAVDEESLSKDVEKAAKAAKTEVVVTPKVDEEEFVKVTTQQIDELKEKFRTAFEESPEDFQSIFKSTLAEISNAPYEQRSILIDYMLEVKRSFANASEAVTRFQDDVAKSTEKTTEVIEDAKKAVEIDYTPQQDVAKDLTYAEQMQQLKDRAVDAQKEVEKLKSGFVYSNEYKAVLDDINAIEKELNKTNSQLVQMERLGQDMDDEGKYEELAKKAHKLEQALKAANSVKDDIEESGDKWAVGFDEEQLKKTEGVVDALTKKMALLQTHVEGVSKTWSDMSNDERMEKITEITGMNMKQLASTIITSVKTGLKEAHDRVRRIRDIVTGGIKKGFMSIHNVVKKLGDRLKGVSKDAQRTFNLKNILAYALGIRGLFTVIQKLRSFITEGIRNLAQWNDGNNRTNESISMLLSSLIQLKNALATAFEPILNTIAPALNYLIDLLIQASNALSQFFAKLTGQSSWMRAKKVQEDYAKSLDKTGKAAGKAAGALAGFDDLDVLNRNNGGGGGSSTDPNDMFEEIPIDQISQNINDLIAKLKVAWDDSDFTDIGKLIGDRIKDALDNISWSKIKASARKIAKSIATLINGFLETEGLATSIGKTIAEAINTAFTFLNIFVNTLHWDSLGKFIGEGLLAIIKTIDAKQIGDTIGGLLRGGITAAFNMLKTFMAGDGFKLLGQKFTDAINAFLKKMSDKNTLTGLSGWQELALTLTGAFNGAIETLGTTLRGVDWTQLAKDIADGINTGIANFDAERTGRFLHDLIQKALNFTITLLKRTDFEALGKRLGEFIASLDLLSFVDDVAALIWNLIKAGFQALGGIIKQAPLESALVAAFLVFNPMVSVGKVLVENLIGAVAKVLLESWVEQALAEMIGGTVAKAAASEVVAAGGQAIAQSAVGATAEALGSAGSKAVVEGAAEELVESASGAAIGAAAKGGSQAVEAAAAEASASAAEGGAASAAAGAAGVSLGLAIAAGIVAAIVGYKIGEKISQPLFNEINELGGGGGHLFSDEYWEQVDERAKAGMGGVDSTIMEALHNFESIKTLNNDTITLIDTVDSVIGAYDNWGQVYDGIMNGTIEFNNTIKGQMIDLLKQAGATSEYINIIMAGLSEAEAISKGYQTQRQQDFGETVANIKRTEGEMLEALTQYRIHGGEQAKQFFDMVDGSVMTTQEKFEMMNRGLASTGNSFKEQINWSEQLSGKYKYLANTTEEVANTSETAANKITTAEDATNEFQSLWTNYTISNVDITQLEEINTTLEKINELTHGLIDTFEQDFGTIGGIWETSIGTMTEQVDGLKEHIDESVKGLMEGDNSIDNLLTIVKTKVGETLTGQGGLQSMVTGFVEWFQTNISILFTQDHWTALLSGIPVAFQTTFASAANAAIAIVNSLIDKLNNFSIEWDEIKVGDESVVSAGNSKLFKLPKLDNIPIPRLATGAVIPPNKEFLAMLGDQKHGTNIEAPLDMIKAAFEDVVANMQVQNVGSSVMELDGQQFARVVTPYIVSELERRGYNVSVLEA